MNALGIDAAEDIPAQHHVDDAPRLAAHVVLLTNFVPPHCLPVYCELARRVQKLTVLVSTPMESNRDWQVDWSGLNVHVQHTWTIRLPWRHPYGFQDSLQIHIPRDTLSKLAQLSPDIVISSELGVRSLLAALYCRRRRHVRMILSCGLSQHTELGRGRVRKWLRRWLVRQADYFAVNGCSGQQYLEELGVPSDRIRRVPYTPAPAALYWGPVERDPAFERRLLYVGQLIERKGIMPFAEVLANWAGRNPDQRIEWNLVGDGPLYGNLKELAFPHNVTIRLLGPLPFRGIADRYSQAGVLVLPTLADEWGLVVNEAMTAGLPVLGSVYSQAVTDLCTEGETGWLFRPDRPGEMYAALDRCFATAKDKLGEMRLKARDRVRAITPAVAADSLAELATIALRQLRGNARACIASEPS